MNEDLEQFCKFAVDQQTLFKTLLKVPVPAVSLGGGKGKGKKPAGTRKDKEGNVVLNDLT